MANTKTSIVASCTNIVRLIGLILVTSFGLLAAVAHAEKICPKCHHKYPDSLNDCPRDLTPLVPFIPKHVENKIVVPHHDSGRTTRRTGSRPKPDTGANLRNQFPLADAVIRARLTSHEAAELDQNLLFAVRSRDHAKFNTLLTMGADLKATQKDGQTALMLAATNGDIDFASGIIQRAPELVNATTTKDTLFTALMFAARSTATKAPDIITLLLQHGANVNAGDLFNRTALSYAVNADNADAVRVLLAGKADPNIQETLYDPDLHQPYHGNTPLMIAAIHGNKQIAELLLQAGADRNVKKANGDDAEELATDNGHDDVATFIRSFVPASVVPNPAASADTAKTPAGTPAPAAPSPTTTAPTSTAPI